MTQADGAYLIWSHEHSAWWRPNSCGYTTSIDAAGRYSREQAIAICADCRDGFEAHGAPNEIPVRERDVLDCRARVQARKLRAQKPASTDPDRLERLAQEAEKPVPRNQCSHADEPRCSASFTWDDGVPYCDVCGMFRASVQAKAISKKRGR